MEDSPMAMFLFVIIFLVAWSTWPEFIMEVFK